jgi:RimJ/RimL family protein N-acetyltransferase
MYSHIEMLQTEMDLLWAPETGPELVIACAADAIRARIASVVPPSFASTIHAEVQRAAPSTYPLLVERLRRGLEDALGAAIVVGPASGPTFILDRHVAFTAGARLIRFDSPEVATLRKANPGKWEADEWEDLLDGRLGAWVVAVVDTRVASICHTPICNAQAAEAGVWTHPAFRGNGYAAACTAEWATIMRPSGRLLFYSTACSNRSSQRVAARLGLQQIGCLWQLARLPKQPHPGVTSDLTIL